jgi:glycosyltransferase involved in cell wall biosynthesis
MQKRSVQSEAGMTDTVGLKYEAADVTVLTPKQVKIAVVIPCYNEEPTIATVVTHFREQLPQADIYVFDNNSTDHSVERAQEAGAFVLHERRQGKGYVVQSMFRLVDADVYIMVDGDATYPADDVHRLIQPILWDEADMVVGSRLHSASESQFKSLNRFGNNAFLALLNATFKVAITDMLSGYRAFSRRFVKSVPLFGGGFEIETELTIKALERGFRIVEIPVNLTQRPEGSFSKIRIARDGIRILNTILSLFRDYKPLTFFGTLGSLLMLVGVVPGFIFTFFQTNLLHPVALTAVTLVMVLAGMLSITVGMILHTIVRRSQEFDFQLRTLFDELRRQVYRD